MAQDFGYFGKGISGYIHYNLAFKRNFPGNKKPPGNRNCGCLTALGCFALGAILFSLLL